MWLQNLCLLAGVNVGGLNVSTEPMLSRGTQRGEQSMWLHDSGSPMW